MTWFHHRSYAEWFKVDGETISLSSQDRRTLLRLSKIRFLTNRSIHLDDLDDLTNDLKTNLLDCLHQYQGESFVKTGRKSSKNDGILKPCRSILDVVETLTSSWDVHLALEDETEYIVMKKWRSISRDLEYRVIVVDGKVKAISQQDWFRSSPCQDRPELITRLIQDRLPDCLMVERFRDCVIDVYIDCDQCQVIEVNPPGFWGSSGSSLFNWVSDFDLLTSKSNQIAFRRYH